MIPDVKVTVCDREGIGAVLQWLYRELPDRSPFEKVEASRSELDPENVLVAAQAGQIRGVLITQPGAGRVGWLWPPALGKTAGPLPSNPVIANLLIRAGVANLAKSGTRLTQVLLPPDSDEATVFEASGFVRLTEILRMERELLAATDQPVETTALEFLPYGPRIANDFHAVIERTYLGSMDCPELDGLRPIEEVLESYRACGTFRPDLWHLARRDGCSVGCLLLAYWTDTRSCELQYMGVVPEARGKEIGRMLCDRAILDATRIGALRICVSVDVRNGPAISHYRRSGFVESDRRIVFVLNLLGAPTGEMI